MSDQPPDWGQRPEPTPQAPWAPPDAGRSPPPPPYQQGQPPGWSPPGYPHSAYPPPGYPPPQAQEINGFAIAALALGILGVIILSPIFAIVALRQIPRRNQRGKGLAIGGLVATAAWVVLIPIGIVVVQGLTAPRNDAGEVAETGSMSVEDLRLGDCINGLRESSFVLTVEATDCSEPHDGQVFAVFDLPDGDFPGEDQMTAQADSGCFARLAEDFPETYADKGVGVFFYHPTAGSWREGDREIVCVADYTDSPRTGSLLEESP